MRLVIATPTELIEDVDGIVMVRAEDATGSFGIEPGHADFLTVLPITVVSWRTATNEGVVVVRGGILTVEGGDQINVATRGAWREDQLADLASTALAELRREDTEEDATRTSEQRLHFSTMRQVERLVRGVGEGLSAPRLDKGSAPDWPEAGR